MRLGLRRMNGVRGNACVEQNTRKKKDWIGFDTLIPEMNRMNSVSADDW